MEGGVAGVEETLFWAFKAALLGAFARKLQGGLKKAVFGAAPAEIDVNMGVLKKDAANDSSVRPFLSGPEGEDRRGGGEEEGDRGWASAPIPCFRPMSFAPVTSYGSQELPLMTGAVDLIVVGDQFVNPSLAAIAAEYQVAVVPTETLKGQESGRLCQGDRGEGRQCL